MPNFKVTGSAIFCAVALLAIPLLASAHPKADSAQVEKKSITLDNAATVDGTTLTPGSYNVLIEGKTVKFERDGKVVASAPCDWKALKFKAQYNGIELSAKNAVQELQFEGSKQALDVL